MGFQLNDDAEDTSYQRIKSLVNEELKNYFRGFSNHFDEITVFRQLNKNEVREIAAIMLDQVFKRLKEKDITLDVTDSSRTAWWTRASTPRTARAPAPRGDAPA